MFTHNTFTVTTPFYNEGAAAQREEVTHPGSHCQQCHSRPGPQPRGDRWAAVNGVAGEQEGWGVREDFLEEGMCEAWWTDRNTAEHPGSREQLGGWVGGRDGGEAGQTRSALWAPGCCQPSSGNEEPGGVLSWGVT